MHTVRARLSPHSQNPHTNMLMHEEFRQNMHAFTHAAQPLPREQM